MPALEHLPQMSKVIMMANTAFHLTSPPHSRPFKKIGRQNQRVAQQHFYGRRGEHIFLSEKCFQFL